MTDVKKLPCIRHVLGAVVRGITALVRCLFSVIALRGKGEQAATVDIAAPERAAAA
jgi:hypothetical protein